MRLRGSTIGAVLGAFIFAASVKAQTGGVPHSSAPPHNPHASMTGMHRPVRTGGIMPAMQGTIVGNKNTKVYHLATDKGLPAEKNRVYFRTEAAARAAGYRPAKMRTHMLKTTPMHRGMSASSRNKMGGSFAPSKPH